MYKVADILFLVCIFRYFSVRLQREITRILFAILVIRRIVAQENTQRVLEISQKKKIWFRYQGKTGIRVWHNSIYLNPYM